MPIHETLYEGLNLPDDDTEPDEHGNEPRECVVCDLAPHPNRGPVQTTNRSLFSVNHKLWIDPVCTAHDDLDPETKVKKVHEYGGIEFVVDAIQTGVFSRQDAIDYLPDNDSKELVTALQ